MANLVLADDVERLTRSLGELPEPVFFLAHQAQDYLPTAESVTLLGVRSGRSYFAIDLPSSGESPPDGLAELGEFRDDRSRGFGLSGAIEHDALTRAGGLRD